MRGGSGTPNLLRLPLPPRLQRSSGRQQEEKAVAHFILGSNLGPMPGHGEERIPGHKKDEADKDSEVRGEVHSPVEGRWPPGPGYGGRVVPFSLPSLPSALAALIRERERLPLNSPEESSRLSIHTDLHVLEPEQTKGKCVLPKMGSTAPLPEAWVKTSRQRGVQLRLETAAFSPILLWTVMGRVCGGGKGVPRQGGRSPENRVAPCLSPERIGAHSTFSSQGWA